MKKTSIFITALALTALTLVTSCQKDSPEYRILTGEKVRFSVGNAGAGTKAVYSGKGDKEDPAEMTLERIDWKEGDKIRIYCEAVREPATKMADYIVTEDGTPNKDNPEKSETDIEAVEGVGLCWGENPHTFYAVYPSPASSGITGSISGATVTAELTQGQAVHGDITVSSTDATLQIANPDLNNMLMTAMTGPRDPKEGIGDGEVFLAFTPLTTAVKFIITNQTKADLTLKSVSLISAENALNGPFTVDIANSAKPDPIDLDGNNSTEDPNDIKYSREYPECTYTGSVSDATSMVTISFASPVELTYDADPDKSGSLTFTFFLQPCQNFNDLTFKLVKSDNSWMSTRLGYTDGSGIIFPRFMKTTMKGLFVPEGAQWTVKYGPAVDPWTPGGGDIEPIPEIGGKTFVTSWDTENGENDDLTLEPKENNDLLPGKFSIDGSTKVSFSRGNLYCVDKGSNTYDFKFEAEQYHFRTRNQSSYATKTSKCYDDSGVLVTTTPSGTSGLFQWIARDNTSLKSDHWGAFNSVDLDYNQIALGSGDLNWGDAYTSDDGNTYFTLSNTQWDYLLNSRTGAANLKVCGSVDGVLGLILAPDGHTSITGKTSYTKAEWRTAEEDGLVFLPAAGTLSESDSYKDVKSVGQGFYWTCKRYSSDTHSAMALLWWPPVENVNLSTDLCNRGCAVRLVTKVTD